MKSIGFTVLLLSLIMILAACGSEETADPATNTPEAASEERASEARASDNEQAASLGTEGEGGGMGRGMGRGMGGGMGRGMGGGMMARHHAAIPGAYSGLTSPILSDEASIARGEDIYVTNCASCHGDGGMGDGPAAAGLDPAPAPIAHTSQMLRDDYLYWRISEGGADEPFNSSMIAWKDSLEDEERWDVINYVRALGSGQVRPGRGMGGAAYDPAVEEERQAEMLSQAVAQGVITEEEAEVFAAAHGPVDDWMIQNRDSGTGSMDNQMAEALAELVEAGQLTQSQADIFASVHDRLSEAGLMP